MNPYLLAAAAALKFGGALLGAKQQKKAIEHEAREVNRNEASAYSEIQYRQEDLNTQAAERMTDTMRDSARQLSMARVLAAEGQGQLKARAFNINASLGDSLSRLEATRRSQMGALQQQKETVRLQADAARDGLRMRNKANRYQFLAATAQIAGEAISSGMSRESQEDITKGKRTKK